MTRSRICPACGKLNAGDAARCLHCGERLPAAWESEARRGWARILGSRASLATYFFMVLSLGVYVALLMGGGELLSSVRRSQALRWGALAGSLGLAEPWRYLSAMFVHFSLLHVGFNTLSLHSLGKSLEEAVGSARFILVFLGTGIVGFVLSQVVYTADPLTGGISGGVFGLLGASVGLRFAQRDPEWKRLAVTGVGYAVAMYLLLGSAVNHAAHVGGLLSGIGLGWVAVRAGHRRSVDTFFRVLAGLLIAATLASIALSLASPVARRAPLWIG